MIATFTRIKGVFVNNGKNGRGEQIMLCDAKGRAYWPNDQKPKFAMYKGKIVQLDDAEVIDK